jgi:hypothetical protein
MPAKKLTDGVIASIAHDHFELGKTLKQISRERDLARNTVQRAVTKFRNPETPRSFTGDQRQILEQKAYLAVESGLDAENDPYKRANIGLQTLKGLNIFTDDDVHKEVNIHIQNLLNGIPPEWQDRYIANAVVDKEPITIAPEE